MSKILLIDNQPMIRFATRVLLEREGYEIVGETENGVEGLGMARSLRPTWSFSTSPFPSSTAWKCWGASARWT